ncbi:hypothetical protein LN042_36710 [Kitasatospora sp. RB6PN24]|uniref:hypothetical protein n=1 Tax=Kitasatospora humi TaxID=2893891 RepID=UPI001E5753FC|nr:hypothetical protein [Kitasatospora humi]MCC9312531.1 hypothetical protein [Kitasatospora humi]
MELTGRGKRWLVVAVGVIGLGVAACYAWGDDYPLPYKTRDASLIDRVAPDDPVAGGTAVEADDRTITLHVDWGGCDYRPDLVAEETADRVTLVLKRRDASGPGVGCEDGGVAQVKTVLHRPLGTRGLVDAVTGKPIPHTDAHT